MDRMNHQGGGGGIDKVLRLTYYVNSTKQYSLDAKMKGGDGITFAPDASGRGNRTMHETLRPETTKAGCACSTLFTEDLSDVSAAGLAAYAVVYTNGRLAREAREKADGKSVSDPTKYNICEISLARRSDPELASAEKTRTLQGYNPGTAGWGPGARPWRHIDGILCIGNNMDPVEVYARMTELGLDKNDTAAYKKAAVHLCRSMTGKATGPINIQCIGSSMDPDAVHAYMDEHGLDKDDTEQYKKASADLCRSMNIQCIGTRRTFPAAAARRRAS